MIENENDKKRHNRICDGFDKSNSIEDLSLLFCYATLHKKEKEISTRAIERYGFDIYELNRSKTTSEYPCKSVAE